MSLKTLVCLQKNSGEFNNEGKENGGCHWWKGKHSTKGALKVLLMRSISSL